MATSGGEREERQAWTHDNLLCFWTWEHFSCVAVYGRGR